MTNTRRKFCHLCGVLLYTTAFLSKVIHFPGADAPCVTDNIIVKMKCPHLSFISPTFSPINFIQNDDRRWKVHLRKWCTSLGSRLDALQSNVKYRTKLVSGTLNTFNTLKTSPAIIHYDEKNQLDYQYNSNLTENSNLPASENRNHSSLTGNVYLFILYCLLSSCCAYCTWV